MDPADCWHTLHELYESKNTTRALYLFNQLQALQFKDSQPMADYCTYAASENLTSQLHAVGEVVLWDDLKNPSIFEHDGSLRAIIDLWRSQRPHYAERVATYIRGLLSKGSWDKTTYYQLRRFPAGSWSENNAEQLVHCEHGDTPSAKNSCILCANRSQKRRMRKEDQSTRRKNQSFLDVFMFALNLDMQGRRNTTATWTAVPPKMNISNVFGLDEKMP